MLAIIAMFVFISLFFFILHIVICIWAFKDASRRTGRRDIALLVLIAVFFFPFLGSIVYLFIRNELR
ncbi:MAG: hypothetical protein WD469_12650 [Paenibacillaceae bacterium]